MIALVSALVLVVGGLLLSACSEACTNDEFKAKAQKWCSNQDFELLSIKHVSKSNPRTYLCEVKGRDNVTRHLEIVQGFFLDDYNLK